MKPYSKKPVAIDLFCGLGGWTEGLLAEGYDVTGYDIEAHEYGDQKYPAKLVLQDVLAIHGSQFKDAALIVASPPCQSYSYMAMPFSRGKKIAAEYRSGVRSIDDLNALFNACFRIQREACEAAGRHIPMVVENVKGTQPWVGPAKAHFGSFYLWGDVDMVGDRIIAGGLRWDSVRAAKRNKGKTNFHFHEKTGLPSPSWHGAEHEKSVARALALQGKGDPGSRKTAGVKSSTGNAALWRDRPATSRWSSWHDYGEGHDQISDAVSISGTKVGGSGAAWFDSGPAALSSRSHARKAASAQIAKIPLPLSSYIARAYRPMEAS